MGYIGKEQQLVARQLLLDPYLVAQFVLVAYYLYHQYRHCQQEDGI